MASSVRTGSDGASAVQQPTPARSRRDTLAHTGPLLALLIPILLVFGLAALTGVTTDTVVLILAVVALLVATFVVISGVMKLASAPPEEDDDGHEIS
ncbi:MAG: hypothetical protein ACYCUM_10850 [Solirubrobacteraceae bacterium]